MSAPQNYNLVVKAFYFSIFFSPLSPFFCAIYSEFSPQRINQKVGDGKEKTAPKGGYVTTGESGEIKKRKGKQEVGKNKYQNRNKSDKWKIELRALTARRLRFSYEPFICRVYMFSPYLRVSVSLWDGFVNKQHLTTSKQNYKTRKAEAAGKFFFSVGAPACKRADPAVSGQASTMA